MTAPGHDPATDGTSAEALRLRFPHGVGLRETVTVVAAGAPGALQFHGPRGFEVAGADAALRLWIAGLAPGHRWTERDAWPAGAETLLAELAARDLLVAMPGERPHDRLTRQRLWLAQESDDPDAVTARIDAHRAVVVGCGGTGAIVAVHLAAMGIGGMLLVDHDRVEVTNLNRQYTFRDGDVGRRKVDALRDHLAERYPGCQVDTAEEFLNAQSSAALAARLPTDAEWTAFCCADRPVGVLSTVLADMARRHGGTAVFGAVGLHEAAVGPLLHPDDDRAHDGFAAEMAQLGFVAGSALTEPIMSASVAPVNTVTAAWMVSEWLYGVVLGRATATRNRRVVVDLAESRITEERIWGERAWG